MKTTRHSLLAKGIMVLLSLLVMVFVFTYSWYKNPEDPVESTGMSFTVRNASTDFDYAIGFSTSETGGNYFHTEFTNEVNQDLNLEALTIYAPGNTTYNGQVVNLLRDYTPVDITGDGVTLIRPAMNYGNWEVNEASGNYSAAQENVQYISFDMIFRTRTRGTTIKLDSDSYAKGSCETYAGDGNLNNALSSSSGSDKNYNTLLNPSDPTSNKYGRFSRDAIVGAVRVAFLNYVDTNNSLTGDDIVNTDITTFESTPTLLWIPRPDLFLNNGATTHAQINRDGETAAGNWTLDTNVSSTKTLISRAQENASYSTYEHQYYNIFETISESNPKSIKTFVGAVPSQLDTTASGNKVTFGQQTDLLPLTYINDANSDGVPDDGYYYGKIRIRIWIEGTDSESRRALAGGNFNVSFSITG